MMQKVTIVVFMILSVTACNKEVNAASSSEYGEVDFEVYNNVIIVEAFVNDKWSKFIVDTGASISILDSKQSKKYGFTYSMDLNNRLTSISGKSKLMRTSEVSFAIQGVLKKQFRFSASDLGPLNTVLAKGRQHVLGILGNDFLQANGAIIDYRRRKLLIASIE